MFRVHAAHRRLTASLVSLTDDQVRQPSLLPDWTVGHVLAHIALNAEAFVSVAQDLKAGRFGEMYPGGVARRNADIEQYANDSAVEQRAHIDRACSAFDNVWPTLTDEMLQGEFGIAAGAPPNNAADVPFRRLREVEVHLADAGLPTFSYEDWSDSYVDSDLPLQLAGLAERLGHAVAFVDETGQTHLCGDGALDLEPIATTRRRLLAWSFNRIAAEELPPIGGWQR
jgi:maleylpyruvate isomerase